MHAKLVRISQNSFFHILLILLIQFYFLDYFRFFPMSEDAGFYAFMSKSVVNGSVLHKDIPLSSNSISIYFLAFLMNLFETSLEVFRMYYLFFFISLSVVIYFISKKEFQPVIAILISLSTLALLHIPHITLDLGRNSIIVSIFLLYTGIWFYFSSLRHKFYCYGASLGLAAINRETFLFIAVFTTMHLLYELYFKRINTSQLKTYLIGGGVALSINAIILTIYNSWPEYLVDMLSSGTKFRYSDGFFSLNRIYSNLKTLNYGYSNFYSSVVFFALFSYSFHSSSKLVNYFKFIIFPALFFEAIIVNKTVSYSVQPLLVTAVFLGSQTLLQIPKILHVILQDNFKINKVFVTCILLLTVSGENIQNIFVEYNHYGHLTKRMKERKIPNLSPYRLLDITNRIKHNSVATYSEYPFLFLSQENYSVKYPYVEDLAAPGNLGREKMWIDQLTKLKKFPPNILVDKTSASFLSKWTDLGKVTVENYIEIYHLTRDGDERRYSERIHISKAHFNKTYVATGNDYLVKNNSILTNPYNSSIIAKITSQKDRCITNTTIKTSFSSITHNENTYNNKEVYSFILPNNQILISNPNINCEKYKVQLYSQ